MFLAFRERCGIRYRRSCSGCRVEAVHDPFRASAHLDCETRRGISASYQLSQSQWMRLSAEPPSSHVFRDMGNDLVRFAEPARMTRTVSTEGYKRSDTR